MPPGRRVDPYANFAFRVEIDGITSAGFRECSGLESTVDVTDYREGGDNLTPRRLPGMTTYASITLRRGLTDDAELYEWHRNAVQGTVERKNGSIVVCDHQGAERLRWNFVGGWPSKWTGPSLNAAENEIAIEALEIVHEGMERA